MQWPDGQTIDETQVRRWWQRWPKANVGIITGAVSNLLVVDIDPKNGGQLSLDELEDRHGFPETAMVRTGSGGLHLYYGHPGEKIAPSAGKLGEGIDIRCDRGLVVAPPSMHADGAFYVWFGESRAPTAWSHYKPVLPTPAPCPSWLVEKLRPQERPLRAPVRPDLARVGHRYIDAVLEGCVADVLSAPAGQHDWTINAVGYRLGRFVGAGLLDEVLAQRVLDDAAAAVCDKPHDTITGLQAGIKNPVERSA